MRVQTEPELVGQEVAITGRLASMTHAEAHERIAAAGGRPVGAPGPRTSLLVVGQGGPPLGEDGRLTRALRAALALQADGLPLRIAAEEELLGLLGLEERQSDLHRLYTSAQLARILGVPMAEVRSWVRHGLIRPVREVRRLCFFDFQQVASARALSRLARAGVSPARIRASLEQLSSWLPDTGAVLAQIEVLERGGALGIRTDEGKLAEASGQLRLEFAAEGAEEPAPDPPPALRRGRAPAEWFALGVDAEDRGQLEEARAAYERALAANEAQPDVLFNLGNVLYSLERREEAALRFLQAAELVPDYVEAWNNLGNALFEMGNVDESITAYGQALAVEPRYADAHYNLAEAHASRGEFAPARRHWLAYLAEDPASSWAEEVRARLRRTEGLD